MRTFRLTYNLRIDQDVNVSISTEVIIADDEQAADEGEAAMRVMKGFIAGVGRDMPDDA